MNLPLREEVQSDIGIIRQTISKILYSKCLPIQARHSLFDWIQNRIFTSNFSISNPNDTKEIETVYEELIAQFHLRAETFRDPFARYILWSAHHKFKRVSPAALYQILQDVVEKERPVSSTLQLGNQVILLSTMNSKSVAQEVAILAAKCLEFRRRTNQFSALLASFKSQEQYQRAVGQQIKSNATAASSTWTSKKSKYQFTAAVTDTLGLQLQNMREQLETSLSGYLPCIVDTVHECLILVQKVVENLLPTVRWYSWELSDVVPSMTDVQNWYSELIDICCDLRESVSTIPDTQIHWNSRSLLFDRITSSIHELSNCHNSLLENPIAFSVQPAETVRTTKISSIQVKLLCGNKFIAPEVMPQMKVILINESQAQSVHQFGSPRAIKKSTVNGKGEQYVTRGTLTGTTATCSTTGTWAFEKLSIKAIQRQKPIHKDSVLEEKFCFLVYITKPQEYDKIWWCCSRPFFVIVNNSQNSKVAALAFIEESFRVRNRKPFDVPESVPCSKLIAALEYYFLKRTNCQRGFTPTNKAFLRSKLLKHVEIESDKDPVINLKRLSENEKGCCFTFFDWFTGIITLTNSQLKVYWENSFIIGFIDRLKTKELLLSVTHDGAFIVRFSVSKLNSFSVSYVLEVQDEEFITASLTPVTYDTLKGLSLPEILHGRIYHGQTKRDFTRAYFYDFSEGFELLKWKQKSDAFPPLTSRMNTEKRNHVGYVKCNLVLPVDNPDEAEDDEPPTSK